VLAVLLELPKQQRQKSLQQHLLHRLRLSLPQLKKWLKKSSRWSLK
jgi:hypothetical protein